MNKPTLQDLLSDLVEFYPVSSDQDNVLKLLEYTKKHLSNVGLKSQIMTNNGVHMLYASTLGKKTAKIMLQGHVDVVPAELDMRKARVDDGKIYGRGVRDMLFATAGYIKFFYDQQSHLKDLDVSLLLTGDEEIGSANTVPWLIEQGYLADVVWLPDAGGRLDMLVTRAKGAYNFDLFVNGMAHHGSRPWEGDNAIDKLLGLLNELKDAFAKPSAEVSTCTITQLESGDSINKGPADARAHIDIRYIDQNDLQKYQDLIDDLCQRYDGRVENLLLMSNYDVDIDAEPIQRYIAINQEITGQPVWQISNNGSSDARFFSQQGIPVIMTRPTCRGSHADVEWLDLDSFEVYQRIMTRYLLENAGAVI